MFLEIDDLNAIKTFSIQRTFIIHFQMCDSVFFEYLWRSLKQIINFNLSGISRSEYEAAAAEAAQPISEMPGLISKRWLANEETNTYGGVYFWETKQHMQDWMDSQIFKDIGANPAFANAKVTDFEMIESLSAVTRGV